MAQQLAQIVFLSFMLLANAIGVKVDTSEPISLGNLYRSVQTVLPTAPEPKPPQEPQLKVNRYIIGAKENWETEYYVIDSGKDGPSVMVVGGMHGNEPAGYLASDRVKDYKITNGKLIVLPRANAYGISKNIRNDAFKSDLNRSFPRTVAGVPTTALSKAIWEIVKYYDPSWLMDLHEGLDYHVINAKSVGQSVIYDPNGDSLEKAVSSIVTALNKTVDSTSHRFSILRYPAVGGIARSASDRLGIRAMIVETSKKDALSRRVAYHELAVTSLLRFLGMQ